VKRGPWIQDIVLGQRLSNDLRTNATILNDIRTILINASRLINFRVELFTTHPSILELLPMVCAHTLSNLYVVIHQQAMDSVVYINELQNLASLLIGFRPEDFRAPPDWKPWTLPRLKSMKMWTSFDEFDQCKNFLVDCSFPVLECLELQVTIHTENKAASLLRLYRCKQATIHRFFVRCENHLYSSILPHLTGISHLLISSPRPSFVTALHPFVCKLYLRCHTSSDISSLYDVLESLLANKSHSVRTVRIEFGSAEFRWMEGSVDDYIVDGTVHRGNFIHRLVGYMARGLVIVDEDDNTLSDKMY
jgi:hypothetical protein